MYGRLAQSWDSKIVEVNRAAYWEAGKYTFLSSQNHIVIPKKLYLQDQDRSMMLKWVLQTHVACENLGPHEMAKWHNGLRLILRVVTRCVEVKYKESNWNVWWEILSVQQRDRATFHYILMLCTSKYSEYFMRITRSNSDEGWLWAAQLSLFRLGS